MISEQSKQSFLRWQSLLFTVPQMGPLAWYARQAHSGSARLHVPGSFAARCGHVTIRSDVTSLIGNCSAFFSHPFPWAGG